MPLQCEDLDNVYYNVFRPITALQKHLTKLRAETNLAKKREQFIVHYMQDKILRSFNSIKLLAQALIDIYRSKLEAVHRQLRAICVLTTPFNSCLMIKLN